MFLCLVGFKDGSMLEVYFLQISEGIFYYAFENEIKHHHTSMQNVAYII